MKIGGWAGGLLSLLRKQPRPRPKLTLLERINIAPRQSVALIEAEGRRFLVAMSVEGAPAFHALDGGPGKNRPGENGPGPVAAPARARVSW
jgi:flagellar biogenesis protein FliO